MCSIRKTFLILLVTVFLGTAETYYYIKESGIENPSNVPNAPYPPPPPDVELIEIDSDSVPETPPGFQPITEEAIHNKGLQTPTESFTAAQSQGNVVECNPERGFYARSWINFMYLGDYFKRATCGSETSRSWYSPGTIALKCQTKEFSIVVDKFPDDFPNYYTTWGWSIKHTYTRNYWKTQTRTFNQHGWHHWGNPATGVQTDITKTW